MAAPEAPPESVILSGFSGLKNTVSQERLGPADLERAINIDLDDAGQVRRRRGYTLKLSGAWHSLKELAGKTVGVRNGMLGVVRDDYTFLSIVQVGDAPLCYTAVDGTIYFSGAAASGTIDVNNILGEWGRTDGQGLWLSPVRTPTNTLGAVGGKLLGDPIRASCIEAYNGRIYLAEGKTLWATELYLYNYVDRTKNYMQFEHDITLVMSVSNGIYVGTTGGLYFIQGVLGKFQLAQLNNDHVLRGSGQFVPVNLVHPQAKQQPMPDGFAAVFMTSGGIVAGFDNGTAYNLTVGTMIFPDGVSAASLFRQDQGANSYIAAVDSAGGPSSMARIGDYVDAEIVRRL